MTAAQKSENPAATGLHAELTKTENRVIVCPDAEAVNPTGQAIDRSEFQQLRAGFLAVMEGSAV